MTEDEAPQPDPATLIDKQLPDIYQRTSGEPGDETADALAAEIDRRNLDV